MRRVVVSYLFLWMTMAWTSLLASSDAGRHAPLTLRHLTNIRSEQR